MFLIDTHTHIYLNEFQADREKMLERAENESVAMMLMPAIDLSTHHEMLALEKAFPERCISMMGLHPCSVREDPSTELAYIKEILGQRRFVAVGEIGLDLYWDKTFLKQQYDVFNQQIEWALEYDLPIVIHSREAIDECIKVVRDHQKGDLKGVFHCFSGTVEQAKEVKELGFYLGIGGVVTFKKAGLDIVIKETGLDRVVLETDAPYLAPVPFRGKRNEPSYLKYIIEKLADISNMNAGHVASITTANAKKLFSL